MLYGMSSARFIHEYQHIISPENLLLAWNEFRKGKRAKSDVQEFEQSLMRNIFALHRDLAVKRYLHGPYVPFNISDPKPRNIHKATVRDRLLHHAIYRVLYPFFDRQFINDSYSCRDGKGTHKAMNRLRTFAYTESRNHTRTVWVLKCDVRKFFASIDHAILLGILERYIPDKDVLWLVERVVESFHSTMPSKGLPLGNLTSQLFVNIYMNEFDQFMKHNLKARYYIRYADDFVLLSHERSWPENILPRIQEFLRDKLKLELHPDKVFITTFASGVDFLGWVHFADHRVLRVTTKKRVFRGAQQNGGRADVIASYQGLLKHGNTHKIQTRVLLLSTSE
jgi:RNA-directed DNA polymerase